MPILLDKIGAVAKITLNRPEVFNSFNREMALAFQTAMDVCAADAEIRCILITGNGKAFCAGQDLKEVTDPEQNPGFQSILEEHYNPIIRRLRAIKKPVVMAVNGVAAGAGANIALAGDVVLAADTASFIQAFSKIGLVPDSGGTYFLPRLVGFQKALALAMLGDKVTAADAERMGMIYKVFPADTLADEAWKIAETLSTMPTKGLGLTKRLYNQSMSNTLEEQLDLESLYQIEASDTADYREGVSAFIEKRVPIFKGE